MSSTNSSYAAVSNGYIDSLINYVLDVKPYHTKLNAIVESYFFQDTVNVKVTEYDKILAFLGADVMPSVFTELGVRLRRSNSWYKDIVSNGQTTTWRVPFTYVYKYASDAGQEYFVNTPQANPWITVPYGSGTRNAAYGLPYAGIPNVIPPDYSVSVFNPKRWDGPGVAIVTKNGSVLTESQDYFLSKGVFTFDTLAGSKWKESDLNPDNFSPVDTNKKPNKKLKHFWQQDGALSYADVQRSYGTITNIVSAQPEEWTLVCTDATAGTLSVSGSASGPIGSATYGVPFSHPQLSFEFVAAPTKSTDTIVLGETFLLTPAAKITVAPGNIETWSLIKVNPIGSTQATYLVYGSASGFSANATVGKYYWNGKIGFKIPALQYFAQAYNSTIAVSTTALNPGSWNSVISSGQILLDVIYQSTIQNGVFFAVGENSIVGASVDGLTWTSNISSLIGTLPAGEQIIITGDNGSVVTSSDGITWIRHSTGVSANIHGSTYVTNFVPNFAGLLPAYLPCIIAVGDNGTIVTSVTGQGWATQTSGVTENLYDVITVAPNADEVAQGATHAFVAVGQAGTVLRSLDRTTWVPQISGTANDLNSIIYVNGALIAVGQAGTILRSTDNGVHWFNVSPWTDGTFASITYDSNNDMFVAVGPDGWTAYSVGGEIWPSSQRYSGKGYNAITFGAGRFVAVGGKANDFQQFVPLNLSGTTLATDKPAPSLSAVPSVYTVTFTSPSTATVSNNINGYVGALKPFVKNAGDPWSPSTPQDWTDGVIAFRLNAIPGVFEYESGDIVKIFTSPSYTYDSYGTGDGTSTDVTVPLLLNQELFPLFHSHGAVIIKNTTASDIFTINKAYMDGVRLQILGAGGVYPELGTDNDWVPLWYKFYQGDGTVTETFSNLTTKIEAYAPGNETSTGPYQLAFTIVEPESSVAGRYSSALLTFDQAFFAKYLTFNTKYSLEFLQDESYGQTIRVKITENLKVFGKINLELAEGPANDYWIYHYDFVTKTFSLVNQTTPALDYNFGIKITESPVNTFIHMHYGDGPDGTKSTTIIWFYVYDTLTKTYVLVDNNGNNLAGVNSANWLYLVNPTTGQYTLTTKNAAALGLTPVTASRKFYSFNRNTNVYTLLPAGVNLSTIDTSVFDILAGNPNPIPAAPVWNDVNHPRIPFGIVISDNDNEDPLHPTLTTLEIAISEQPQGNSPEHSAASFAEGLTISEIEVDPTINPGGYDMYPYDSYDYDYVLDIQAIRISLMFDVLRYAVKGAITTDPVTGFPTSPTLRITQPANEYVITLQNASSFTTTPTIIVKSVGGSTIATPTVSLNTFVQNPDVLSLSSFRFSLPTGFTAPFDLWIVNY